MVAEDSEEGESFMNLVKCEKGHFQKTDRPYVFISYSHKNNIQKAAVCNKLSENQIRYWFDDGLHSGDDWNMMIAESLRKASVCLLLLSEDSASSEYVKNELNFAMNHRIPIHVLLLEEFVFPSDIEMMLGRIQMVFFEEGYIEKLVRSFPPEVQIQNCGPAAEAVSEHPLFDRKGLLFECQGTSTYLAVHRTLGYECLLMEENTGAYSQKEIISQAKIAAKLKHPLFPDIYDIKCTGNQVLTWQEKRNEQFLSEYLKEHVLSQEEILYYAEHMTEGMNYLYKCNLALKDFPRGSVVVLDGKDIGLFRMQNPYYGPVKMSVENREYYFEKMLENLAIFIYQLCTGEEPVLPIGIVQSENLEKLFARKMNLIIQKMVRENKHTRYLSFEEVLSDLKKNRITLSEEMFLRKREKKLKEYQELREKRKMIFTEAAEEKLNSLWNSNSIEKGEKRSLLWNSSPIEKGEKRSPFWNSNSIEKDGMILEINPKDLELYSEKGLPNLEEQFGFDSTVVLSRQEENKPGSVEGNPSFSILICATGEVRHFRKESILIGKSKEKCDLCINQPALSRIHAKIECREDGTYRVTDMDSVNGVYYTEKETGEKRKIQREAVVEAGTVIWMGEIAVKVM